MSSISRYGLFEERDPEEIRHSELNEAVAKMDVDTVRAILKESPKAALGRQEWQASPIDKLVSMRFTADRGQWLECLGLLLDAGVNPYKAHKYQERFAESIVKAGHVEAVAIILEKCPQGAADHDLFYKAIASAKVPGGVDRSYQLAPMIKTMLDAGMPIETSGDHDAGEIIDKIMWTHREGQHPQLKLALTHLIEAGAQVRAAACVLAMSGGNKEITQFLIKHSIDDADTLGREIPSNWKPEQKAEFGRLILEVGAAKPANPSKPKAQRL